MDHDRLPRIFVSYRRDDSIAWARLLHNELAARFGPDRVFMDLDDIGYGDDFAQVIDARLSECDVVIVVIGPQWARMLRERARGDDWVRHEVVRALALRAERASRFRVLPVVVDKAPWPVADLPPDLAGLTRLNALFIHQQGMTAQLNALIEAVQHRSFRSMAQDLWGEMTGRRLAQLAVSAIGMAVLLASWTGLFDALTIDTRMAGLTMSLAGRGPDAQADATVVVVGFDEATVGRIGRPFGPSWRSEHARLIRIAADAGARALAFDITFERPGDARADEALVQAAADVGARMPVIVAVQQRDGSEPLLLPALAPHVHPGLACAGQTLSMASSVPLALQFARIGDVPATAATSEPHAAGTGAQPPDPGNTTVPPWPSLGLAAFVGSGRVVTMPDTPGVPQLTFEMSRAGDVRTTGYYRREIARRSQPQCPAVARDDATALQLMDPATLPDRPPLRYEDVLARDPAALAGLHGRIVFVGDMRRGPEEFAVGLSRRTHWGVELFAWQASQLAAGRSIVPLSGVGQWLLATAVAMAGSLQMFALRRRTPAWRIATLAGSLLLLTGGVVLWYRSEGELIDLSYLMAALGLGALAGHWLSGRRRNSAAAMPTWQDRTPASDVGPSIGAGHQGSTS